MPDMPRLRTIRVRRIWSRNPRAVASCPYVASAAALWICAQLCGAPVASAQAAPEAQQAPDKFLIAAIDVAGATRLTSAEIERLVYPHLGPDRSNADVVAAQKALQDAYAAKGYDAVLVDVPIQPDAMFRLGIVQIVVHETPLGRVRIVGAEHHSMDIVRAQMPSLVEGQAVDLKALQRDVASANRFPDRTIDPVFRPGQVPGTLDVDLKVDDARPYHASIEANNDHSPSTEPLRLAGTVRYTDLWDRGHSFSATYSVAPQNRSQSAVFSASYTAPFIGSPWSILIYGYTSNSNVAALGGTNVLGDGTQIGLRAIYRLPNADSFQQISVGPDFKSFRERIFLAGQPIRPTPIHYVPVVAEYTLAGSGDTTTYGLTLSATLGLRVVKHRSCIPQDANYDPPDLALTCRTSAGGIGLPQDQFLGRGIDTDENFIHLNLDLNHAYTLPGDLVMALRFAGQFSDSPLVTNEQFGVGGMTNVRGYYVSEAIGDDGFNESVEIRSPDLAARFGTGAGQYLDELRVFSFGDVGYARIRRPATDQDSVFRIASVGGGLRFRLHDYVSGEALIGVPVVDGPVSRRGDPRYSFSIRGEF